MNKSWGLLQCEIMWQYTAGRPPLSQPSNYSWPSESSSGFSHLWPGVFHIFLPTHKTQLRGWKKKKNKQSRVWVSSKRKKEEVCDTFLVFCASVSQRERVLERNSPQNHEECWLILSHWPIQPESTGSSCSLSRPSASLDFCRLVCFVRFSWQTPSLQLWDLPSPRPLLVSREILPVSPFV